MHTLISFLIVSGIILTFLVFYHKIDVEHIIEIMHSAFSRQFIFEIIPFIILFSVREMKFVDISSASDFFNSVIGRTLIGTFAFTFVTFSLNSINPRVNETIIEPSHSIKLNSFTSNVNVNKEEIAPIYEELPVPVKEPEPIKEIIQTKEDINAYEKYITYATI
jgi:hypothetical protein